jgi:very-short-patch-repair endonuclease
MHEQSAKRSAESRIAGLADRQHGVVTRRQLLAMGVGRGSIDWRVGTRLHPVHRGVYAVGHSALTREGRWLAAVLACGPHAVLSHRSAAALWGIRPSAAAAVEVAVATSVGRRHRRGIAVHRTRALPQSELTELAGIPLTTLARTLLDLAVVLDRRGLEKAIDDAERLGLFDLTSIHAAFRSHPGRHALARALERGAEPIVTRSELEEHFLTLCERQDIPRPKVNARVGRFEVDFLWPNRRLIVETDGRASHETRAAFERDRARDAELTANGYRVVRFTYRQVERNAGRVAALLTRLIA